MFSFQNITDLSKVLVEMKRLGGLFNYFQKFRVPDFN
jgi:hypothetical protein